MTTDKEELIWDNIYIQYNKESTRKATVQIRNQCIYLYEPSNKTNYYLVMPIYKINYDINIRNLNKRIIRLINRKEISALLESEILDSELGKQIELKDINSEIIIVIYHKHDLLKAYLGFSKDYKIIDIINFIKALDSNYSYYVNNDITKSIYIKAINESNANIYGKLMININSISIANLKDNYYITIILDPYQLNSITFNTSNNNHINQTFLIPLHNKFGQIIFNIVVITEAYYVMKRKKEIIKYQGTLELTQVLNIHSLYSNSIDIELYPYNTDKKSFDKKDIYSKYEKKEEKIESKDILNISVNNLTQLTSLIVKNRNKKVLEDLIVDDDNFSFQSFLKRTKKIILYYKQFKEVYYSLFTYKYPIFSTFLFIIMLITLIKVETKYLLTIILFILIILMISFSQVYKDYLSKYINIILFSIKNPYDFESKFIYSLKEFENLEVTKKDYLINDDNNILMNIIEPIKFYREIKNSYFSVLYFFTNVVSTIEKIKNLLFWEDPMLSFYFLLLSISLFLIIYKIDFKYLLLIAFSKKFITGIFYYYWKWQNNNEIGRIILEYCLEQRRKSFESKPIFISMKNDLTKVKIFDEQFKEHIKESFKYHCKLVLRNELFNLIQNMGDIQIEVSKYKNIIKIRKDSPLYSKVENNNLIYFETPDIDDLFYYFVKNIKSDYYIIRHNLTQNDETMCKFNDRITSLSSDNII